MGEFVDFGIAIKGPVLPNMTQMAYNASEARGSDEPAYDLGGGAALIMSKRVRVDGVWRNISAGYPKVTFDGEQYLLAFRFPKHDVGIFYDPVVGASTDESTSTDDSSGDGGDGSSGGGSDGSSDGTSGSGDSDAASSNPASSMQSLSAGAIAGIAIAVIVAVGLIVFGVVKCLRARSKAMPYVAKE